LKLERDDVARRRELLLSLLLKDLCDLDLSPVRHQHQRAALLQAARHHLAHRESAHVRELLGDRNPNWQVHVALDLRQVVKVLDKGRTVIPIAAFFGNPRGEAVALLT